MPVPNAQEDGTDQAGPVHSASVEIDDVPEPSDSAQPTVNEIIIIDPECPDLDLNHGRIGKIQNLEPMVNLERLYLRWNFIRKIENLDTLTNLVELELYDNQISKLENLDALVNLEILDMSFNRIKEVEGLDSLVNLKKLYLSSNKIHNIKNLNHLVNLNLLELGDNKIREIENLECLTNLQYLYLGKNKITQIKNVETLTNLTCLSLQSNRLTKIENLGTLKKLTELYLSENGIKVIENLEELTELETLDLAKNEVTLIENIAHLQKLEEFWMNDNQVADWNTVQNLSENKKIQTVYLEANPVASDPMYRRKLKMIAPSLTQIDATLLELKIACLDNLRDFRPAQMFFPHHTVQVKKMSDQQFVLRWHYHESTLLQNLPSLLENDILTDVTLSVGTQFLKAHRIVLAMCSVYFLQIFQEMGGSQNPVIVLHNVNIEDVKAVLSFMYRGQCIVTKEQLPSLLSVARLLKIQGLCDMKVPEKPVDDSILNETKLEKEENHTNKHVDTKPTETQTDDIIHDYTIKSKEKSENVTTKKSCSDTTSKYKNEFNMNYVNWDNLLVVPDSIQYDYNQNYNISTIKKPAKDTPETCKCFLCGKYLSNQYNLRVHMETHEEAYHACQSCPHVSRSRDALRKHVSYRHPEEYHTRKRKKTENV